MIQLNILSNEKELLEEVTIFLLSEKLIINANIDWDRNRYTCDNGITVKQKVNLLTCISKSLLFNEISDFVNEKFKNKNIEIYSTAIVNMDWNLSQLIVNKIKKA